MKFTGARDSVRHISETISADGLQVHVSYGVNRKSPQNTLGHPFSYSV